MRCVVPALAMAMALRPSIARTQPIGQDLVRVELLREADEAHRSGDHARTLELASRAGRIRMTPSVRLMIAQEHSALGHVMEALVESTQCGREAEDDPALNNRERILRACRSLSTTLGTRVARVTITPPAPAPTGLRIRVQGVELHPELWGASYPVLPGALRVDAESADGATFHHESTLAAGESASVAVVLIAPRRPPPASRPPPVAVIPPAPASRASSLVGPVVMVGAGALSFALAGVFFGLRGAALSDRDAAVQTVVDPCDQDITRCDYAESYRLDSLFRSYNLATNVSLALGAAAVAGGVLWWILTPRAATPPALSWSITPHPQGAALTLAGAL